MLLKTVLDIIKLVETERLLFPDSLLLCVGFSLFL